MLYNMQYPKCQRCGKLYLPRSDRITKYCSRNCYQMVRQEKAAQFQAKLCEQCGTSFGPAVRRDGVRSFKLDDFKKRRFCSPKCHTDSLKLKIEDVLGRLQIDPVTNCHIWTGTRRGFYGSVRWNGKSRAVHRIVWEHFRSPVPEGMQMDHTCGAKLCCNVDHLRVVTPRDNSLAATSNNMAARNHRRVKCPQCGGPYSAFPNGIRYCKPCRHRVQMAYQRKYRARKRKEKE